MKNKSIYNILFFLLCFPYAFAQNQYVFRSIDVTDGLAENTINDIALLSDDRVVVYTQNSLSLYDGATFSNYPYFGYSCYAFGQDVSGFFIDSSHLIWIKSAGLLYVFDVTREKYIDNVDSIFSDWGVDSQLQNFFVTPNRYWFENQNEELFYYDIPSQRKQQIPARLSKIMAVENKAEHNWIVHDHGDISYWNSDLQELKTYNIGLEGKITRGERIFLKVLLNGNVWLMCNEGLWLYTQSADKWTKVNIDTKKDEICTSMTTDDQGMTWVGTSMGRIFRISQPDLQSNLFPAIRFQDGSTKTIDIRSIYLDQRNGGIWIGQNGICYYHPSLHKFKTYNQETLKYEWNGTVNHICEFNDNTIWLATMQGIYSFHKKEKVIKSIHPELKNELCRILHKDSRGYIWVCTVRNGLFSIKDNKIKNYKFSSTGHEKSYVNNIYALFEDHVGDIWVGVHGGIGKLDRETGRLHLLNDAHPELNNYITPIGMVNMDEEKMMMCCNNGFYFYYPQQDSIVVPMQSNTQDKRFRFTSSSYTSIFKDSRGLIWLGCHNAMTVIGKNKDEVYRISQEHGLPNSILRALIEDDNGDIWVPASGSVNKINITGKEGAYNFNITTYGQDRGILKGDIYSSYKSRNGELYFGGMYGFNILDPNNLPYNSFENHPILTSLKVFDSKIIPEEDYNGRTILDKSITYTDTVRLKYDENFITLTFSGLNFVNPTQTYYRYRLSGIDKEWRNIMPANGLGEVSYSNLTPGSYTFEVFTANNDRLWGSRSARLTLLIAPPFWDTPWAHTIYVILFITTLLSFVLYVNHKNKQKLIKEQEIEIQHRKEELDQMKFRFFTNISHEFRTPLTLIITPLDTIIKKLEDEKLKKQLESIFRNAQEMLSLVNQLLDFRKLEMKGEKLNLMNGDITGFVSSVYENFSALATEKHICFTFEERTNGIYMYFDPDKLRKILQNLLSNAFKFTPVEGRISLLLEKTEQEERHFILIKVTDTGIGIAEDDLPHIFDRFYQTQHKHTHEIKGSGIGLHLIKEYVHLHEGEIEVNSKPGQGTSFSLRLPSDLSDQPHLCDGDSHPTQSSWEDVASVTSDTTTKEQTILVVEDNRDFRQYLKEQLSGYHVIVAADGEEGEEKAIKLGPDLIISDIMMPKMDGLELCRRIKANIQTSHIPVILLTARISDETKISGYEVGADSYISKPFNFDMLLTRIRKLIEQREKRRETFRQDVYVSPASITITPLDEEFIHKALKCVEDNMDNSEFSLNEFGTEMNMSRSTLYRKFQSITGQSTTEFIRSIRLKRAIQLMDAQSYTIAEIAYQVGFETPRYFSKVFKEVYGELPSQYIERLKTAK